MIAITILAILFAALTQSLLGSMRLNRVNRETALAQQGMNAVLENLSSADFATLFQRYDSDASDDPAQGRSPGADFAVPGLQPEVSDVDGYVGRIVLPELIINGGVQLREDLSMPELGMPRDLDGDGLIDSADHAGDYRILPVLLRVEWHGESGSRVAQLQTIVAGR